MSKHKPPKLIAIDLSLGNECKHPDIKTGRQRYLILYDGEYYAGTFGRQWYGLNFNGVYDAGLQFDTPGYNHSRWQCVWQIVGGPRPRKVKRVETRVEHADDDDGDYNEDST